MLPNAFIGKTEEPTGEELAAELGASRVLWDQLVTELAAELDIRDQEWHSYSRKAGWSLRLKRKERNIVYLSPSQGSFVASFALGDKAIQAARAATPSRRVLKAIAEGRRYAEGTAVRVEVARPEGIADVKKLAQAKVEH